jgi:GT2 family glycosyltransferase
MARRSSFSVGQIMLLAPRAALPWTICVLFYGNYPHLCRRFLERLYRWTDPRAFRLRAGLNAVCRETFELVQDTAARFNNVTLFNSPENIYKCPMMRRMFHDPLPETEWTVWFDDDSHVTGPGWIIDLAIAMQKVHEAELIGSLRRVDVSDHLEAVITSARWYQGLPRSFNGERNARTIVFPVGGFWAVRTARIREVDWPDARLTHFEDDYLMGEAMRQHGVKMFHFESGVSINDAPRRAPDHTPTTLPIIHS